MSQTNQIYSHLKKGRTLTALQALKKFSCLRLASRIRELRQEGYPVKTVMVEYGDKRVARYSL